MTALQQLTERVYNSKRKRYPNVPAFAQINPKFNDVTSGGLTHAVTTWLSLEGVKAWRQSSEGRYRPGKTFTDVIGRTRIMKGQFFPGQNNGAADVHSIIDGKFIAWEIKIGRDRQSKKQEQFQMEVEASGGKYFIVRSFDEFMNYYKQLTNKDGND